MTLYVENLRAGLTRAMDEDASVVILGEDILDPYGGAFKATKGLSTRYPDRVFPTPISEGAIAGLATGLAIRGLRPVAEIMFGDFLTLCTDQIVNSAAKFPLMYEGTVTVPSIIRTPVAGARGYGPTHSQSLEKLFFGVPGLSVVAPSRAHDPGAMLCHLALHATAPCLFVEDKGDYAMHLVEQGDTDLTITPMEADDPLPTLLIENHDGSETNDITLIGYGGAASLAMDAMRTLAQEEIFVRLLAPARVNNLQSLGNMLSGLAAKAPVLVLEQGTEGFNWSSEITALMMQHQITSMPVTRLAAQAKAIPAARHLEGEVILTKAKISEAIFEALL